MNESSGRVMTWNEPFFSSAATARTLTEKEDFAALTLADFCRNLLMEPYQVLPFDGVGVEELLQGQPKVCKRAVYDSYAHGSSMSTMFTGSRWLNGIPEPQWSSLLFGPDTCDICGNCGALPDFVLQNRLCEACWGTHVVHRRDMVHIISENPQNDLLVVWSLVPRTFRRGSTSYLLSGMVGTNHTRYMKKDVEAMVDRNALGANGWAQTIYSASLSENTRFTLEMAKRCMTRLENIGHDPLDTAAAQSVAFSGLFRHSTMRLTRKVYRKIKPDLERMVNQQKRKRLVLERKRQVKLCYTEYSKTLKSEQWTSIMPLHEVFKDAFFNNFVSSEADVVGDISKKDALALFPQLTLKFMDSQVNRLASLLPEGTDYFVPSMDCYSRLNLATSVFGCRLCQFGHISGVALCGWTNICSHINQKSRKYASFPHLKIEFNPDDCATSASLIRSLGLDPATTTQEQLDLIDARFFCGSCPILSMRGVRGRKAYTWTECVGFFAIVVVIQLLTPEATRFVKEQEPLYPSSVSPAWGCNHCSEHFEQSVSLSSAKAHVNESRWQRCHRVQAPVQLYTGLWFSQTLSLFTGAPLPMLVQNVPEATDLPAMVDGQVDTTSMEELSPFNTIIGKRLGSSHKIDICNYTCKFRVKPSHYVGWFHVHFLRWRNYGTTKGEERD
ncbi:uncharacterized protein LACBIDRAFT_291826 [Laccaria bicolor S238N-H82]|uniref:Predicted protein n=1 Tax=Laccaria bicolor (strain S238N-H82 / ATCC MYA-4686) TaxID=486041 RepID=B0CNT4_LACBS|nr:uncharacterized protein LACBIDRAFT_291826 [Laccaria bicolor S238N-H82]EDR15994.1 predicted protein [Laccaria bicolor S238N-H82]|eukprot:XP_001874202.1 predicted protein [Laccaria bicolor S238N-H82]